GVGQGGVRGGCGKSGPPQEAPTTPTSASVVASAGATPSGNASADVTTHASPMHTMDAGPPVITATSVDGEALRKRHHDRLATHAPVTILRAQGNEGAFELGKRLCETMAPKRPPETPELLKPNIGGFDWFKDPQKFGGDDGVHGRTTDPEFTRGVIRCLKARGHTKITVAEGWGATHKDWEKLVTVGGYAAMCKEENVPLVAM